MSEKGMNIAVVGSGISGLSCAWLLSKQHRVTLFEKDDRFGGHSHTVTVGAENPVPVDTGFIVFNERTYPNLTAFFKHLQIPYVPTEMSFGVSLGNGSTEYAGTDLNGLFAQKKNLIKPGFWLMIADILRFYRNSGQWLETIDANLTLGQLLHRERFSQRFIQDHLIPMGAAIWSTPADKMLDYPALAFLRFCMNHGLLQLSDRPQWQTVQGGSREYVQTIIKELGEDALTNRCIRKIKRYSNEVRLTDIKGKEWIFDHVVMASHADTTLELLSDPDELEQHLLGGFSFQRNKALLHSDEKLMPVSKNAWASWNYLSSPKDADGDTGPSVTYWMNRLQHLEGQNLFVTLNPAKEPDTDKIHGCYLYDHPVFNLEALEAQRRIWELQGRNRTWYCGAWMGYGFHEDGLQSGLAVAESLGGIRRPWQVKGENDRLHIPGFLHQSSEVQPAQPA
ncbi:FAD-dependent oxidoreductase [uncultured Endozoicomonas sp.]|uniref:NAD(P)/FAD-dependent oxidoreductase n=1 Tax=uncultured Endozoicomonas sp. TaxID=432652 RepID=UPI0026147B82|nr:FAD-dependent oxidoreductase [uncultured Endozoicomonas sp.]